MLRAGDVAAALARGAPTERAAPAPPAFAVGARVRARTIHPSGHTRLPRYVRGHCGVVVALRGAHVFADSHARGAGEDPRWLYTVRFDGRTLWGDDGSADAVHVDCWEPYLEPAENDGNRGNG